MHTKKILKLIIILFAVTNMAFFGGGKWVTKKKGNVETKKWVEKKKVKYKIKYTYSGNKIIKGEYFKKKEKVPSIVRVVKYNKKGLPVFISHNAKVDLKVKVVNDIYEIKLTYTNKNYLKKIERKNKSKYTITKNLTENTITDFKYDKLNRISKVKKTIGISKEETSYFYKGKSKNMVKTVYKKAGFSTKFKKIMITETITTEYKKVPWKGNKKYIDGATDFISKISTISIYDNENNVEKMQLKANLSAVTEIGKLVNNEKSGPQWRMGDLPDAPNAFAEKPVSWY